MLSFLNEHMQFWQTLSEPAVIAGVILIIYIFRIIFIDIVKKGGY